MTQLQSWIALEGFPPSIIQMTLFCGRAFLITDAMSRKDNITTSGATAVAALIKRTSSGKFLYVANVGDSRAVLCSSLDQNKFVFNSFSPHSHLVEDLLPKLSVVMSHKDFLMITRLMIQQNRNVFKLLVASLLVVVFLVSLLSLEALVIME
jgi:serine/threonine protein phosphatase PrpC